MASKHHIFDKRITLIQLLYIFLVLYLFGSVIYDSFIHDLPFYYILFFILGRLLGVIFRYTQVLQWDEDTGKIIRVQDTTALILFITFMLFRIFALPGAIEWVIHPHLLSDALFLISAGVFYSGIIVFGKQFNSLLVEECSKLRNHSQIKKSEDD